jgi:hypothetical protein
MMKLLSMATVRIITLALLSCLTLACGGSSSNEGGEGSGGSLTKGGRTAVRIIHASVDTEPLDLRIADRVYGRARFMEEIFFNPTPNGSINLQLEQANFPGTVITSRAATLQANTEYSLLVTGRSETGTLETTLLEEAPVSPPTGSGRVQFINALAGISPLTLEGPGINLGPVPFKNSSGFVVLPAGTYVADVERSGGRAVGRAEFVLAGGDEVTVVIGGDNSQGIRFVKIFRDLD